MLRVLGNPADAAGLPVPSFSVISPDPNYTVDFHELQEPELTMAAPIAASEAVADPECERRGLPTKASTSTVSGSSLMDMLISLFMYIITIFGLGSFLGNDS